MYGKNMEVLLGHLLDEDNSLKLDFEDEIIHETVIAHGGDVPHTRMRELVGLPALPEPETQEPDGEDASGETS
jgi:NAD(P) transhydrogenase subunit alpha